MPPTPRLPAKVLIQDYVQRASRYLDLDELVDHTGMPRGEIDGLLNKRREQHEKRISPEDVSRILGASHASDAPITVLAQRLGLADYAVRQALFEAGVLRPDSFEYVRLNGGRLTRIPKVLQPYIIAEYDSGVSSREIARGLESCFGIVLTGFGIRNLLNKLEHPLRTRQVATQMALGKLTPTQEEWLVSLYQSNPYLPIQSVRAAFQGEYGDTISASTVIRILVSRGLRPSRRTR